MSSIILRLNHWWNSRTTSAVEVRQAEQISMLQARVAALEEQLATEQSKSRIQQTEIAELAQVIARNLERVRAETRVLGTGILGGNVVKDGTGGGDA